MASVLKAQKVNAVKAEGKGKGKRKADAMNVEEPPAPKKNKQRVLLLSSRGVTHRMRHLMNDLEALLPHVKKGPLPSHRRNTNFDFLFRFETRLKKPSQPTPRASRLE